MLNEFNPVYKWEIDQLTIKQQTALFAAEELCELCFKSDHDPEQTWSILHSGLRSEFKELHQFTKDHDLPNLRKWLGRRYNMLYNVPKDFEIYRGRVYEPVF